MDYSDLTIKFFSFNHNEPLGAKAIALYLLLLDHYRSNDFSDFSVSDVELSNTLKITPKTVKITKEKLRIHGLIQFQTSNGLPSSYRIITNYSDGKIQPKVKSSSNISKAINKPTPKEKEYLEPKQEPAEIRPKENPPVASRMKEINTQSIPTLEEFLLYAKNLKGYSTDLDYKIEVKYDSWVENGWKNGFDRPITNWQSALKKTLPYLSPNSNTKEITTKKLPTIIRPKSTYNE